MSQTLVELKKVFKDNEKQILQDFFTFLKFPSISTEASYKSDVLACAAWVAEYVKQIGFEVQTWETTGHPTIFASYDKAGPDKPTLLIYNHYDVQPVDPLSEWKSPPFEPTIRDGEIYARGAQDNKGQCFYTLVALKMMLALNGSLPINVKLCIEGEEEAGSAGIAALLKEKSKDLQADYLAIVDVGIKSLDQPSIILGVRGLISMDVEVQGSSTDLHSGSNGGLVFNPIHALVQMLASARDANGKITIPGFYDDVVEMNEADRKMISWDFDQAQYEKMFGTSATGGEQNFSPNQRNWIRPTLEINGINGGYTGSGFKTVIPAKAWAKISCRIVPNQTPEKIGQLVANYLEKQAPKGIKVKVHVHAGGGVAAHADKDSKVVKAFAQAYQDVFNKPCQFVYEGATIPIIAKLSDACRGDIVLVGLGLADDQIHAPNEHFGINRIEKGVLIVARAVELLANRC